MSVSQAEVACLSHRRESATPAPLCHWLTHEQGGTEESGFVFDSILNPHSSIQIYIPATSGYLPIISSATDNSLSPSSFIFDKLS